jgi:hypothetical protein
MTEHAQDELERAESHEGGDEPLCSDCPPMWQDTDRTRCLTCPRRRDRSTEPRPADPA